MDEVWSLSAGARALLTYGIGSASLTTTAWLVPMIAFPLHLRLLPIGLLLAATAAFRARRISLVSDGPYLHVKNYVRTWTVLADDVVAIKRGWLLWPTPRQSHLPSAGFELRDGKTIPSAATLCWRSGRRTAAIVAALRSWAITNDVAFDLTEDDLTLESW